MIDASLRSCGSLAAFYNFVNSWCMHNVTVSPLYWYILAAIPSGPGALLGFNSLMVFDDFIQCGGHLAQTEWVKDALCPVLLQWWFLICSTACRSVPTIFSRTLTSLWGWMHHPCPGVVMCFALMDHAWPWLFDRSFLSHYSQWKIVTPWPCFPTTGLSLLWAASAMLILHSQKQIFWKLSWGARDKSDMQLP